ncbi:MAG: NAD(P)/FAD-dependent oxidoreductase, partial [Actinobacteria bacterium]|nr:NAD(P)/FAD-dependent oxidoreductase [Actinomycetota bacterium]
PISGVREANVVTAIDVLSGEAVITGPVAVIGGGMVGCETADYLGAQGKKVTIIEQLDQAASDVGGGARRFLMERLSAQGTEIITDARAVEITADGLVIEQGGERRTLPAVCTVVLAVGMQSEAELARELEGKVKEIYVVGDASRPRRALEAVTEGAMIARQI